MADDIKKKEGTKKMVRAVLLPSKAGIPEAEFLREWRGLTGSLLPYRDYGFRTPFDYMSSIKDTVRITRDETGQYIFHAIADASTAHIANLVKNQKSNKSRKKGITSRRPKYKPVMRHHTIGRHAPARHFGGPPSRFNTYNQRKPPFSTITGPAMSRSALARGAYDEVNDSEVFEGFEFSSRARLPPAEPLPYKSKFQQKPLQSNQTRTVAQSASDHNLTITVNQPIKQNNQVKFGAQFEVPPRFRKPDKENVPMQSQSENTLSMSRTTSEPLANHTPQQKNKTLSRVSGASPHVHVKPVEENYKIKLQTYCRLEKLDNLQFDTVQTGKGANMGYASSVKIRGRTFGSLGVFGTPDRAEMFAAKTACENLGVDARLEGTDKVSPPRDIDDGTLSKLKERVKEILSQRPNGVWSMRLPIEYQERFKENAPSQLISLIQQWTDIVNAEDVPGTDRQILYPVCSPPSPVLQSPEKINTQLREPSPKTLAEARVPEIGMKAEAFLCTVIDCNHFYIHLKDSQIREIQKSLSEIYVQEIKGRPRDFSSGNEFCAAKFEDIWYRAKVISTAEDQVDVFYVDFGNTDRVALSDAKCLHPSVYHFPIQAIQCRLHNVFRRKRDCWDHAAELLFELQDREDPLNLEIQDVENGVCSVDMYPVAGDLPLNKQIVLKGLVGDCVQPKATDPEPLELPEEDEWDVIVSFINSPSEIIVRLLGDSYSDLLSSLEDVIGSLNEDPEEDFNPVEGDICAARLQAEEGQEDSPWCRIRIDKVLEDEEVQVTYLDYGDSDTLALRDVRLLGPDENKMPYQAFSVSLSGLEGVVDTIVMEQLLDMALGKSFVAQVHSREEGLISVTLWDTSTEEDININERLMKLLDCSEFAPALPDKLCTAECFMSHITDDGEVFLQLTGSGLQLLEQLSEEAVTHLKQGGAALFVKKPTTGKLVLALYDDLWYRASVEELLPGRKAVVCFVDYGNVEVIQYSSLREIAPCSNRFARLPHQSMKCSLDGLPPVNCAWTEEAVQKLQSVASDDILLHVEVIAEANDSKPPVVDLFLLDPEGELQSLRELLIADEAIWRESSSLPSVENLKLSDSDIDEPAVCSSPPPEGSSPDVNGNRKEEIQANDVAGTVDSDPSGVSIGVSSLERPARELLSSGELVFITWICNPHDFKLIPGQYREDLSLMMDAMVEYFSEEGQVVEESEIQSGDIYAALNEDQTWYRVKVKDIFGDGQVSVYFVDYGDFNLIPVCNLRVLPDQFRQLPFLVIPAKLTGVEPTYETWSPPDIKAFTDLVLDQMLTVWVLDVDPNDDSGLLPVTLIHPQKLGDEALIHKSLQKALVITNS